MKRMTFWFILFVVVIPLLYVRLAGSDPARWHRAAVITGTQTKQIKGGYIWRGTVQDDGRAALAALDAVALNTPRTQHLAGSVAEGQVTYITRSRVAGFPDYTTLTLTPAPDGGQLLEIYGRLRFGRSDLGVNAKRIKGWVAAADL